MVQVRNSFDKTLKMLENIALNYIHNVIINIYICMKHIYTHPQRIKNSDYQNNLKNNLLGISI